MKFKKLKKITEFYRRRKMISLHIGENFLSIISRVVKTHGWFYLIKKTSIKTAPSSLKNRLIHFFRLFDEISLSSDLEYSFWLTQNFPRNSDLKKMSETIKLFNYKPLISIIIVCHERIDNLKFAIESVNNQIYESWEIFVICNTSLIQDVQQIIIDFFAQDKRITLIENKNSSNIKTLNSTLEFTKGDFISFLNQNDLLTPDALYEVALCLNLDPNLDIIYSDEDKIDDSGKLSEPFFKPDWCPDSFLSRLYISNLCVYRCLLIKNLGRFRDEFNGFEYNDLLLRLTEKTQKIFHIPKILYHSRISSQSMVVLDSSKNDLAIKSLSDALNRRGEPGKVEIRHLSSTIQFYEPIFLIRYHIQSPDLVSIIIPTRDLSHILDVCLRSIFTKTSYPNYEVLVIDNGSIEEETKKIFDYWKNSEPNRFRCLKLDIPFNYSTINNYAVSQSFGKYLLFLNNDTQVLSDDWLGAMVEQAQRPSIGSVGALLLYPDNTIQHAGVVAGLGGMAGESHRYYACNELGYFGIIQSINNYSALTAACLMCRREVFEEIGGFEEDLAIAFNDVDLCFKMLDKGYRNVYLPHVVLYHHESKSRGYEDTPEKFNRFIREQKYMQEKWPAIIDNDPCYNPNLSRSASSHKIFI